MCFEFQTYRFEVIQDFFIYLFMTQQEHDYDQAPCSSSLKKILLSQGEFATVQSFSGPLILFFHSLIFFCSHKNAGPCFFNYNFTYYTIFPCTFLLCLSMNILLVCLNLTLVSELTQFKFTFICIFTICCCFVQEFAPYFNIRTFFFVVEVVTSFHFFLIMHFHVFLHPPLEKETGITSITLVVFICFMNLTQMCLQFSIISKLLFACSTVNYCFMA